MVGAHLSKNSQPGRTNYDLHMRETKGKIMSVPTLMTKNPHEGFWCRTTPGRGSGLDVATTTELVHLLLCSSYKRLKEIITIIPISNQAHARYSARTHCTLSRKSKQALCVTIRESVETALRIIRNIPTSRLNTPQSNPLALFFCI